MHAKVSALFAVAALIPTAYCHYNFESIIQAGENTAPYEYVRRTTNANSPIEDVSSENIVCNAGGLDAEIMAATKTLTVQAGEELGFFVNSELGHPGPQAVYMSKAPGAAAEYKGDGDWFKIYELTYTEINESGPQWATFPNNQGAKNFTFNIPKEVPSGEYLLRAEHLGLHGAGSFGGAQFYIGCAQIKVENGGSGTPSPLVKFPGAYDGKESGVLVNIYYPPLTSYEAPGPVTWPNACVDHTLNSWGQDSDGDCTGDDGSTPAPAPAPAPAPETPGSGNSTSPAPEAPGSGSPTEPSPVPIESEEPTTPEPVTPVPSPSAPVTEEPETPAPAPPAAGEECPTLRRRRLRKARRARNMRRAAAAAL